jgi:hypothetical protein
MNMNAQEGNTRVTMLNSFMTCPHRDLDMVKDVHSNLREKDPVFYAHLATWYQKQESPIRDHNELFCAHLITDKFLDNREVGLALWQKFPVFMKMKILGFIEGKIAKLREKTGKKVKNGKRVVDEIKIKEKFVGFGMSSPASFRKERERYLRWLEADNDRFDSVALKSFNDLKALYAAGRNGVKMATRAYEILYKKNYPEGSKLNIFKQIMNAKSPEEQAKLIVENGIPYTIAVGLVEKITPSITVALINAMSPQELINNMASLEERGVMSNPDIKKLIEGKLEKASTAKNVVTLKSKNLAASGRIKDESLMKKLDEVTDKQVKKVGTINMDTAIIVDASGSMQRSIEAGKRAAAMVAGAISGKLFIYVHDEMAKEIVLKEPTMTAAENAFKGVRPDNRTSMGCVLDLMMRKNIAVDQLVFFTDEGENQGPFFSDLYKTYCEKTGKVPRIVIVSMPNDQGRISSEFSTRLKSANIDYEIYRPENNDYYGLPGLLMLLSRNSKLDLIYEIMDTPLPVREPYMDKKPSKVRKPRAKKEKA